MNKKKILIIVYITIGAIGGALIETLNFLRELPAGFGMMIYIFWLFWTYKMFWVEAKK